MQPHSPRQRDLLRKMGVGVWRLRDAPDAQDVVSDDDDVVAATVEASSDSNLSNESNAARIASNDSPRASSQSSDTLEIIQREVAACRKCDLHATRTNTVFGCGAPRARWLFIGEAPGQSEDLRGEPFVGRAGQLLDRMIAALGMRRDEVFIANVLKCRPPGNRDPQSDEIEQCEPYLHRQLALIQPKVIVALGRISAQALLKSDLPLGQLRAQVHRYGADDIPLVATYHPAYLLRRPEDKAKAWADLRRARAVVAEAGA